MTNTKYFLVTTRHFRCTLFSLNVFQLSTIFCSLSFLRPEPPLPAALRAGAHAQGAKGAGIRLLQGAPL